MSDCKFCGLIAGGRIRAQLPHLVIETPSAIAALNRRPLAPGHVTIILKAHRARMGLTDDADFTGVGHLVARLSAALERIYRPTRVALVGDGKPSAHLHFHLLPVMPDAPADLGAAVADLNLAVRPNTLSDADVAAALATLTAALAA